MLTRHKSDTNTRQNKELKHLKNVDPRKQPCELRSQLGEYQIVNIRSQPRAQEHWGPVHNMRYTSNAFLQNNNEQLGRGEDAFTFMWGKYKKNAKK
jgi:hypothetical protein